MTSNQELKDLIEKARARGAIVEATLDQRALEVEGRQIISTVKVVGLRGVGNYPMSAIAAAERLREVLA